MTATVSSTRADDSDIRLWMIALGLSLAINFLIGLALAVWVIDALRSAAPFMAESAEEERVVTIMPEWDPVPDPARPEVPKRFARTSDDQTAAKPPKAAAFEGERDTLATSDRAAKVDAPELPSQAGVDPRDPEEFETTESQYQDGRLDQPEVTGPVTAENQSVLPQPEQESAPDRVAESVPDPVAEPVAAQPPAEPVPVPPMREKAFEGPNPVDVAAQADVTPPEKAVEPSPIREETPPQPEVPEAIVQEASKETPQPPSRADDPAFSGFQQKTAIVGSISRTGRSALDVEDTPLGRYHAAISRAVELEWQRNCVRHRDFITPGFLTVRFFVEASGKVRSVQFVGDMETGEVQKGFTLNSIRDAPIPVMPDAVKKGQKGEPLELVFRFYF